MFYGSYFCLSDFFLMYDICSFIKISFKILVYVCAWNLAAALVRKKHPPLPTFQQANLLMDFLQIKWNCGLFKGLNLFSNDIFVHLDGRNNPVIADGVILGGSC